MVYVRTTSSLRIYFKASVYSKISFHNKGLAYSVVVRKMLEEPPAFQTFKLFYKSWCILDSILRLKSKQQTIRELLKYNVGKLEIYRCNEPKYAFDETKILITCSTCA